MSKALKEQPQKPQIKYAKVIPSEEDKSDIEIDEIDNTYNNHNDTNIDNKINNFRQWILHKPTSKLPFFYFLICILLSFVLGFFYIMDNDTAFIISGLFAIITALYAFNHFRSLLSLKQGIDRFHSLNKKFGTENRELNSQVSRLTKARNQLTEVHQDLQDITAKTRENNKRFREVQDILKLTNLDTIQGIESIRSKACKVGESWKRNVLQRERVVICRIFDRVEQKDNKDGISKEGFDEFAAMLPYGYKQRFERLGTFHQLASDKSVIDMQDLKMALDVFAEMNVEDCDILFKIDKESTNELQKCKSVESLTDEDMPQFLRHLSITKRSKPGSTFSFQDIEAFK